MYVAGTRKALDIPERAHTKSAFLSGKPIRCSVAIEQTSGVAIELSVARSHGASFSFLAMVATCLP
jgi:hypothetical protein